MPARLKLPHLEPKRKRVIASPTFRDPANLSDDDDFAHAVDRIRTCIINGTPLPSKFYSKGAGAVRDYMLSTYGIMHLHLGDWSTNELLWLVQYPTHVVFLELSDHRPFTTRPPGVNLNRFHYAGIRLREREIDQFLGSEAAAGKAPRLTFGEKRRMGLVKPPAKPTGK
ncbi:hypothetical protein ABIE45_006346 [Methylobacterium sp. OAE515]|uniref:hypothetical protein n=1 Tax=Methylobacterium sp. OAE515 TaxID=2817895 RepID=UPI0017896472